MEQLDGIAIGSVIASGEATAAEVVAEAIQRCEALNPNLNAVIHENFDRAVDRASQVVPGSSPLAGVPMVTKDLVCREAGLPFHEGSRFLKEIGYTSETDQDVAVRFRQGDMVSIGRTNTPEFGMQPATEPLAYGPTHNPWKRGYSPGGSSGGSAAAVAAGIVPIGHGNDVGGSLRNPASMCGLVGLKPSRGRSRLTPDFGDAMLGMAESLVMTRSVRDTAAALDLLVESRVDDVYHHPVPAGGWLAGLATPASPVRVGYLIPDATSEPVKHAVRDTLKRLEELGHHVEDASPAALDEDITPLALPNLTAGTAHIVDRHWPRVAGVDAIPPDLLEPTTAFLADLGRSVSGADLLEARELAQQWTRRLLSWWINDGYDVLVTPTIPVLPPKHGETDDQTLISLAVPFNLSGLPAVSVPAAVHDGLPIGVQLVASMFREDHLLGLAQELETATGWLSWKP